MVIEARISLILSFDNSTEVTLQEKCRRRARGLLVLNSVGVGADESTSMTSHVNKLSKFHQLFVSNLPKSVMSRQTKAEFISLKRSFSAPLDGSCPKKVQANQPKTFRPRNLGLTAGLRGNQWFTRWWQLKYFLCSPRNLGKMIPILTAIFFKWGWFNQQNLNLPPLRNLGFNNRFLLTER